MSEVDNKLSEISIKVIETIPAVVNFNYQEISDRLDSVLTKYKGLVFTDSTVTDCKKTIAELRKGQKALDEFRKLTKKQLTESVIAFENQCKTLYGKFDEVIQPLTQQQNQFELEHKEKKRAEIEDFIISLISEHNLAVKYTAQLLIPEGYFNVSKSMKAIKAELTALANTLKVQQDKEEQDLDLIKTKVQLANAQYQLTGALMPESYLRLLGYKTATEIDLLITADAKAVNEREKAAAEAPVTEKVEVPDPPEVVCPEPTKVPKMVPTPVPAPIPDLICTINREIGELVTAVYEITGTEEQLSALEVYLDANSLAWADRAN